MMKRDRHVRGVASGPALVGPIYSDDANLAKAAAGRMRKSSPFSNCSEAAPPATYTDPARPRSRPGTSSADTNQSEAPDGLGMSIGTRCLYSL